MTQENAMDIPFWKPPLNEQNLVAVSVGMPNTTSNLFFPSSALPLSLPLPPADSARLSRGAPGQTQNINLQLVLSPFAPHVCVSLS